MIGKISDPRGTRVHGLIYYLFGPGRREEHTDAHLIAGWRHPAELEPPLRPDGHRDFRRLTALLQQPHTALGPRAFQRPVWHCALRAAPEDRMLSDDEWAQVAADVMHRTGLSPRGLADDAVRWVAVRHGADHIHIVAMLARQDGGKPSLSNERYRVRDACRSAEQRYGLRRTAPADRTAARRPTRAEHEKTRRHGRQEPPRVTLKRAVSTAAAGASGEQEFFTRLDQAGVLVRKRFSTRNPGEVTGYAVALPGDTSRTGGPVWFSGGKLAADLTWPKLRCRWRAPGAIPPATQMSPEERNAIWKHAARTAAGAAAQIRTLAATDPAAAADAAWAAGDTLHAAAAALGSRTLRQVAGNFDRAARPPYARVPRPTPAGTSLRHTARLLATTADVRGQPAQAWLTLIIQLAALAEAVAELRHVQRHSAQAAAARAAARHLHTAHTHAHARHPGQTRPPRPRTPGERARLDFPIPLRPMPPQPGMPDTDRPARRNPRPPHRPRGPTR